MLTSMHANTRRLPVPKQKEKPVTMLGVRMPTPLHRRLRLYALRRGISVQALILQAVRDLLAHKEAL